MKILKKGRVVEKRGEEETKSMPHAPVMEVSKWTNINKQQIKVLLQVLVSYLSG
jgi:hypothetical protein